MCGLRKLTLEKAVGRLVGDQSLRLTGRDGGLAHAAHLEKFGFGLVWAALQPRPNVSH